MNKRMLMAALVFAAAAVSAFMWAFFNVSWWAPLENTSVDTGRSMVIFAFHIMGLLSPLMWGWK